MTYKSVGGLAHDAPSCKVLTPHVASVESEGRRQG